MDQSTVVQVFIRRSFKRSKEKIDMILKAKGWEIVSTFPHHLSCLSKEVLVEKYDFSFEEAERIIGEVSDIIEESHTLTINIDSTEYPTFTIDDLKMRLSSKTGVNNHAMRFIWNGKQLHDVMTLSFYGVENFTTIQWVPRLRGD
jgi:hypothetical protein